MSKNKFQGHAPRPTKGELTAAAKQQTAKENPDVVETKQQQEVTKDDGASMARVLGNVAVGDQAAAAAELLKNLPAPPATPDVPSTQPKPKETGLYRLGKRYAPKTDRNSATWGKLTKALSERPHTMKELTELVKDHKDFLGYMTRGGHIIPHVAEKN